MVMPSSGPLNMGGTSSPVSVAQELGLSLTATITMNDAAVRTLAGVGGSGTSWSMSSLYGKANTYTIEYLVVAGGGSGGQEGRIAFGAGGGGAGGYRTGSASVGSGSSLAVAIGAGGAGFSAGTTYGTNPGSNSSFNSLVSTGGGSGGQYYSSPQGCGGPGGSGGGASGSDLNSYGAGTYNFGAGTAGQGSNGGLGYRRIQCSTVFCGSGGGGGASAVGQSGYLDAIFGVQPGSGGAGTTWSNGLPYAGGGGGGFTGSAITGLSSQGVGGSGGGGAGSLEAYNGTVNRSAVSGTTNTGGGGGGAYGFSASGSGGSGTVIIRYAGAQRGTGGTVTSAGGYTYHTFTTSGTFTS